MRKALLFDLDDTLYEEKQFVISGFRMTSQYLSEKYKVEYDKIFKILRKDFEKGLRGKNFNILLRKLNLENESVKNLIQIYREHTPSISLYPDAEIILKELKSNKFKLGLITDGYINTQRNKLFILGIVDYFDVILINNVEKNLSKKDKICFEKAVSKLEVKPEKAIYVGDNPLKDFVSPRKLGIVTVRVKRRKGEYSSLLADEAHKANYTISNLLQLPEIIEKINSKSKKKYEKTI